MKEHSNITDILEHLFLIVGVIVVAFISILVFLYAFDAETSWPKSGNVILGIVFFAFVLGLAYLVDKVFVRFSEMKKRIACAVIQILAVGIILFMGITFVSQTRMLPSSDSSACLILAELFLKGDYAAVVPTDSYLSLWPFQSSFIFVLHSMMKLFNTTDSLFFQRINVFFVALIAISGYQIIRLYTKEVGACLVYSLLMCTYLPLTMYAYWVYGNIPAMSMMIFSMWMFLSFIKREKKWQKVVFAVGFFLSTVMACIYKSTSKIYLIALGLVAIIYFLKKKSATVLAMVLVTIVISIVLPTFCQKFYEHKAGNVMGKGVPAVAYLAMGLQYNGEGAIPGGWNGYHADLYISTGYDYEETSRISKESIKQSLEGFKDDPAFAASFLYNKILMQWANETHGVFWNVANMSESDSSGDFWRNFITYHTYGKYLTHIDIHESIIYFFIFAGVIVVLVKKLRKRGESSIEDLLPLVVFIGGFLFSIIWEGQTVAVVYYPVMLLPYGISMTLSLFKKNSPTAS